MRLKVKDYIFDVSYSAPKNFPAYLKKHIRWSIEATLNALPASLMRKHLKKNQTHLLSVSILSKAQIKRLNSQYRGKNKATDVLSFSRLEGEQVFSIMTDIGDLLICAEIAREQVPIWENSYPEEIRRLTVHGLLHLFGYDHELSRKEEKRMFSLQEKILKSYL